MIAGDVAGRCWLCAGLTLAHLLGALFFATVSAYDVDARAWVWVALDVAGVGWFCWRAHAYWHGCAWLAEDRDGAR